MRRNQHQRGISAGSESIGGENGSVMAYQSRNSSWHGKYVAAWHVDQRAVTSLLTASRLAISEHIGGIFAL